MMSIPREPPPCKLFSGVIYSSKVKGKLAIGELEKSIGQIEIISPEFPFDQTEYYSREMGPCLKRMFCVFKGLFKRSDLLDAKYLCFELEERYSLEERRQVNLDPGIVTLETVVLSTFKNFSHRIHIGREVYGDLTLRFEGGRFRTLPWTYPDYKDEKVINFFGKARDVLYRETIQGGFRHAK
jgi:hypothetical protein